ncbi:hypothetical protein [Peribacillus deserti]|uniref:Uncharacterized protein n=1 Tax=Peribacillus deserti TaxID=673318 RepID=A0A2N5M5Z1_9BACI|nr:hypothetical protein [Peribacillus deserti]PLT29767.1 hypothetical protein CUU66_11305 [Peribacillus deserti]
MLKTVRVDNLRFKKELSMIEQFSIKHFVFNWVGCPPEGLDDFLPLEYTEDVLAKMEVTDGTVLSIENQEQFRYVTITEDNQIVMAFIDYNKELKYRVFSMDEVVNKD